ncbi:MAG: hypothetical protein HY741_11305 [Chloroflexi bacterium]|nr:hypothetical protein [Chloroflexota bacterium]
MSIQELQTAIMELDYADFWQLVKWFNEYQNERWDQEIEQDLAAGRLDFLIPEAKEDYAAA